ncbi:MAG: SpoIIE family protein phosphatase [Oscillospiraceae bacterium]|nr:SpoIIE family protein phosphatase [Oscillospiraceae bacterium]
MKTQMRAADRLPGMGERITARWLAHPAAAEAGRCLGSLVSGMVLAGAGVSGTVLPIAAGMLAGEMTVLRCAAALAGACIGAILWWDLIHALELAAVCLLAFASRCVFETASGRNRILPPMCALGAAAVGILFLLDAGLSVVSIAQYLAKALAAFLSALLFLHEQETMQHKLLLCACLVLGFGAATLPVGISLAVPAAALLAAATEPGMQGIRCALIFGLAADLQTGIGMTPALGAAALGVLLVPEKAKNLRRPVFTALSGLYLAASGAPIPAVIAGAAGAFCAIFLPVTLFVTPRATKRNEKLEGAAAAIEELDKMLRQELNEPKRAPETAMVFDKAAEKVCRCCVRYQSCWEQSAAQTYEELCQLSRIMLENGAVERADVPDGFAGRCRHLEGFLKAVNQELDSLAYRRQFNARVQETRTIAAEQYRHLGLLLSDAARPAEPMEKPQFSYVFAVRGNQRSGNEVSGDQACCFRGQGDNLFVLLSDGMGTGRTAAEESRTASSVLTGLLKAGVAPETALQLLNGAYTLRSSGAFATIDLVQVHLANGECCLYKWGAAPSYLLLDGRIKRIGTATIPPGFGVGGNHAARQTQLSLQGEEMLVLLSDGAQSAQTEQCIAAYRGDSPKELAEKIVGLQPTEDDVTAAVLQIHSVF